MEKIFPTIIIVMMLGASMTYITTDWRMAVYWLSASVLNLVVTW